MNILLFSPDEYISANTIAISGDRAEHLLKVQKYKQGDALRVGEINGMLGCGELINEDINQLQISVSLDMPPPKKKEASVFLALPRPLMLKRILLDIAMIGIDSIHIFNSHYVQKSYWQSPTLKQKALEQLMLRGLEQSCDSVMPTLSLHRNFNTFIEQEFKALAYPNCYLGNPRAKTPCPQPSKKPCSIIIGPEKGFTQQEITTFEQAGVQPVTLGSRHLRAETALTYTLGKLIT